MKMKRLVIILSSVSIATLVSFSAIAKEDAKVEKKEYTEKYEGKFYGLIQKLPVNNIGVWVIKGKNVIVNKNTEIEEKHGKIKVGAYVKVEGTYKGKTFTADEIEVKKPKEKEDK